MQARFCFLEENKQTTQNQNIKAKTEQSKCGGVFGVFTDV